MLSKHLESLMQDKDDHFDRVRDLHRKVTAEYAIIARKEEEVAAAVAAEDDVKVRDNLYSSSLLSAGVCWGMAEQYQKALTCLVNCLNSDPSEFERSRAIEAIHQTAEKWIEKRKTYE